MAAMFRLGCFYIHDPQPWGCDRLFGLSEGAKKFLFIGLVRFDCVRIPLPNDGHRSTSPKFRHIIYAGELHAPYHITVPSKKQEGQCPKVCKGDLLWVTPTFQTRNSSSSTSPLSLNGFRPGWFIFWSTKRKADQATEGLARCGNVWKFEFSKSGSKNCVLLSSVCHNERCNGRTRISDCPRRVWMQQSSNYGVGGDWGTISQTGITSNDIFRIVNGIEQFYLKLGISGITLSIAIGGWRNLVCRCATYFWQSKFILSYSSADFQRLKTPSRVTATEIWLETPEKLIFSAGCRVVGALVSCHRGGPPWVRNPQPWLTKRKKANLLLFVLVPVLDVDMWMPEAYAPWAPQIRHCLYLMGEWGTVASHERTSDRET